MARKSELSLKPVGEDQIEVLATSKFNPIIFGVVVLVLSVIGYFLVTSSLGATNSKPGVATQEFGDMVTDEELSQEESEVNFDEATGPKKPSPPLLLVWLLSGAGVMAIFAIFAVLFGMPWWERKHAGLLRQQSNVYAPQAAGSNVGPAAVLPPTGSVLPDLLGNNTNTGYVQPVTPATSSVIESGSSSLPTAAVGPVMGVVPQAAQVVPIQQPQNMVPSASVPNITKTESPDVTLATPANPVPPASSINPAAVPNVATTAVSAQLPVQPAELPQVANIPAVPIPPGQSPTLSVPPINPPDVSVPGNQV